MSGAANPRQRSRLAGLASLCALSAVASAQTAPPGFTIVGTVPLICETKPAADGFVRCKPLWPEGAATAAPAATPSPAPATAAAGTVASAPAPATAPAPAPAPATAAATPAKAAASAAPGAVAAAKGALPAASPSTIETVASQLKVDISVPSSPAFAVLGITPDKVQRPGTARDFASAVTRGIGPNGKVTEAVAIDIAPASVFFRDRIRGGTDYMPRTNPHNDLEPHNYLTRLLARTTLSLGTTTSESDGSARAALGLRVGVIDYGDPGLYAYELAECLTASQIPPPPGPGGNTVAELKLNECTKTKQAALALWAQPAVYAGYGQSWYSRTGSLTDTSGAAKSWWLTGSIGYAQKDSKGGVDPEGLRTMLQVHLDRRIDDRAQDPAAAANLVRQDSTDRIVRIKLGQPTLHGVFEAGRKRATLANTIKENTRHSAFGAEFKFPYGDDAWLQIARVKESGFLDGKDRNALTFNLKMGVSQLDSLVPGGK
jgi:hypothetical protein